MAALTPEERVIHARCRVAGIEPDNDEFGMRLPPCATCTLTLARYARLLGDPIPEAAAAPALNELIAVEVFRTMLTERLDNLDAHLDRVDANIRQGVAGVVRAVRALQTQVEELTAANANPKGQARPTSSPSAIATPTISTSPKAKGAKPTKVVRPRNNGEWVDSNINELKITFDDVKDNTSEFTRTKVKDGGSKRYFDVKIKFSASGVSSGHVTLNEVLVPAQAPRDTTSENKYGNTFYYASISPDFMKHLQKAAREAGFEVPLQDPSLISESEEDCWWTINAAKGSKVTIAGEPEKTLAYVMRATGYSGVFANLVVTAKLKCTMEEAVNPETGTYYGVKGSPVWPGVNVEWKLNLVSSWGYITDIGIDIAPPSNTSGFGEPAPVPSITDSDKPSNLLLDKLKNLSI
ncbi:hypothetical protein QBC32DRAFT_329032 [Pseudoneurospora amorphoporcata]|uniref:Uncharacterized protein n=1 Tax=Pseudoneurospora amorphoporcata TaxID=241081 RepID=A0AAN6NJ80_9PEZI|nr:hypothetical protein QBC32DRAFT_329032 [Pseudoneurospora amorphoporcata]